MIVLQESGENLHTNSIFDQAAFQIADVGSEPSPHVCYPNLGDVFAIGIDGLDQKLVPLLLLDLGALSAHVSVKVPVLYNECVQHDWIVSRLDASGRVVEINYVNSQGETSQIVDTDPDEAFPDGVESVKDEIDSSGPRFLRVASIPTPKDLTALTADDYSHLGWEQVCAFEDTPQGEGFSDSFAMGPFPGMVQSYWSAPLSAKTGKPLLFVGQVHTDRFELADFKYFLFYDPDERIVAQLMQMS